MAGAARDFGIVAFGLALAPTPRGLLVDDEDDLRQGQGNPASAPSPQE
jgi:hypothetical protein